MEWPNFFGITHWESLFRLRKNQVYTSRNWKPSQREILSKDAGSFLKISFFSRYFSHIFFRAKHLVGFSVSRLTNLEDFFLMYMYCLNINIYVRINDCLFKYNYLVYYLKFLFYWLTCSAMSNLNLADFTTSNSHQRFLFPK